MNDNSDLLVQLVSAVQKKNNKQQNNDFIKVKPAKVIGVDTDTYKVFVYFLDDMEQKEYTFYNKTGETLSEGDTVKIYYTTNVAKGWIGMRSGEPSVKECEGVGRRSEWDKTSEYFNSYDGMYKNHAGDEEKKHSGYYATARGFGTKATGHYSYAEGQLTIASGQAAHAEGYETEANGTYSHAEGETTKANGVYSHAEGQRTIASGLAAHAEGWFTKASSLCSHAEGGSTVASMPGAHAEGQSTTASGLYSHAEGESSKATGRWCHAEGYNTEASSECTHAEGYETVANMLCSHVEGRYTKATGIACHAEGEATEANGNYSHAEGQKTKAVGECSHAGGCDTVVDGKCSFGHGTGIVIGNDSPYGRFHIGQYNDYSSWNIIFAVGNGSSDTDRSNAFAVDNKGNVYCNSINGIPINSESSQTFTPYTAEQAVASAKQVFNNVMGGDDSG